jgi:hypothetical protein
MLPFGVTIPVTVSQRSEFPEGLMNYSVYRLNSVTLFKYSGIMVNTDRSVEEEIKKRIEAGNRA